MEACLCKGFSHEPVLVDLFCCEGGASMGYHRAGFKVVGVDLFEDYTQKRYPFESYKGDWQDGLKYFLSKYPVAVVTASPPCQKYSITNHNGRDYPDLIGPVREALIETGLPYVIENVEGAPLNDPIRLCGCQFDLKAEDDDGIMLYLERPRLFESNVSLSEVQPCTKCGHREWVGGCYGGARRDKYEAKYVRKGGYVPPNKAVVEAYMGIDWMTWKGLYQSIPPVYTEFIGRQLMESLNGD